MVLGSISQVDFDQILLVLITFSRWFKTKLSCLFCFELWLCSPKQLELWLISLPLPMCMTMLNKYVICISLLLILLHLQFSNILFLGKAKMKFCLDYDSGHVLIGNCFWDEECCLCSQDWIEHNNCFICILWKGQHGDKRCLIFHMFISVSPLGFIRFKIQNSRLFTGMPCGTNTFNWICSASASCHSSFVPL